MLLRRKDSICVVPQILFEFWVVATRPVDKNGLGLSIDNVRRKIEKAASFFEFRLDTPSIYREWLRIVTAYSVSGVLGHDARLVAAMKVHGLTNLVTFNCDDFKRYEGVEISVFTPADLLRNRSQSSSS
jgi:predicted nucleic acid-binding protein